MRIIKAITLGAVAVLALGTSACGSNDPASTPSTPSTPATTSASDSGSPSPSPTQTSEAPSVAPSTEASTEAPPASEDKELDAACKVLTDTLDPEMTKMESSQATTPKEMAEQMEAVAEAARDAEDLITHTDLKAAVTEFAEVFSEMAALIAKSDEEPEDPDAYIEEMGNSTTKMMKVSEDLDKLCPDVG